MGITNVNAVAEYRCLPETLALNVLENQVAAAFWIPLATGIFLSIMALLAVVNAWLPKREHVI